MPRYIGTTNTARVSLGGSFTAGNQSADSLYDFMKKLGGVNGSAPGVFSLSDVYKEIKDSNWASTSQGTTFIGAISAASPTAGGTMTINGNVIGAGYDYTVLTGNQTVSSFSSGTYYTGTADTRPALIYVEGNFTINSGQTFIPSARKAGTYIYVGGDMALNGTISMYQRGANHNGTGTSNGSVTARDIRLINGTYGGYSNPTIPATGGSGGARGQSPSGGNRNYSTSMSTTIAAFSTQGGQHGIAFSEYTWAQGGKGGDGTCFSGGAGGGCARGAGNNGVNLSGATNADENGGKGGNSTHTLYGCAGANGNPGGSGSGSGGSGDLGTGGVVVIYVEGTFSGSGTINVRGTTNNSNGSGPGRGPGQGSGAGMIAVFCGSDTSSVTLQRETGGLVQAGGTLNSSTGTNGTVTLGGTMGTNSTFYPHSQGGTGPNYGAQTGGFGEIITGL